MGKTAYIFPGQASQYVGMARELHQASTRVRELYALASDQLGADLAQVSFDGPAERLKQTIFTQPAVLVHSLSLLVMLGDDLPRPAYTAGHSLGEYAALACSGALSFEDAIIAVCARARFMEKACVERPGTMAAILALPEDKLETVCREASAKGIVTMANINSSQQVAVSGEIAAVDEACRLASAAGAKRAIRLEVGGAFHSPLMNSATAEMSVTLNRMTIRDANPPVVANVTARPVITGDDIRRLLVEQITSPVRWRETMSFFVSEGIDTVYEIGPGKVLTGLAKREMPGAAMQNIDTLADLEKIKATVI